MPQVLVKCWHQEQHAMAESAKCCYRLHMVKAVGDGMRQVLTVAPPKCCHQSHEMMAACTKCWQRHALSVGSDTS